MRKQGPRALPSARAGKLSRPDADTAKACGGSRRSLELEADRLTPPGADSSRVLLYFFGGGYQVGSPLAARASAARLSAAIGAWALVPAYRLCPEHPLSASLEDALTAYRWLVGTLGSSAGIVVLGESAGGGLALRLMVALRDAGDPLPAAAVVLSPWTDLAMTGPSIKSNAESEALFSQAFLERNMKNITGVTDYRDPRVSPLYADLSGLPPLLIHVSGDEVLRDDSVRLAERAAFFCPRMRRVVNLRQVLEVQVRIHLRTGNTGVSKQFLHRAQVPRGLQQMRRE